MNNILNKIKDALKESSFTHLLYKGNFSARELRTHFVKNSQIISAYTVYSKFEFSVGETALKALTNEIREKFEKYLHKGEIGIGFSEILGWKKKIQYK